MNRRIRRLKRKLKKSSLLLVISTILLIIVIIITFIFGKNIINKRTDYNNLVKEAEEIYTNTTIETYNYNYLKTLDKEITKTKENIILEEALEEFTIDYSNELNKLITAIKDEKYTNLLTANNYQSDGPAFTKSIDYITEKQNEINTSKDRINTITSKTYYTKYIKERTKDQNIIKKYIVIVEKTINKNNYEILNINSEKANSILQTSKDIFIYLSNNPSAWHVENNEIVFNDQTVKTEYEKAIDKIKKVVE